MEIKQHLPHLAAAPVAVAVVSHTYAGLGFEPVALSVDLDAYPEEDDEDEGEEDEEGEEVDE